MLRSLLIIGLVIPAFATLALGQATFEVATVKPSPPQPPGQTSSGYSVDNDRGHLTYSNLTVRNVLSRAYRVARFQITGPDGMDDSRFDIEARFAPGTPFAQLPEMLQALLADRFHLAIHRETREMSVYSLTLAKEGSKLKATQNPDDDDINSSSSRTHWHVTAKMGMKAFAEFLSERVERPVKDETGLTGAFEFMLDWAPEGAAAAGDPNPGPSLFTALQEQLGLKLNSTRGSAEMIVVDQVDRTPTEN